MSTTTNTSSSSSSTNSTTISQVLEDLKDTASLLFGAFGTTLLMASKTAKAAAVLTDTSVKLGLLAIETTTDTISTENIQTVGNYIVGMKLGVSGHFRGLTIEQLRDEKAQIAIKYKGMTKEERDLAAQEAGYKDLTDMFVYINRALKAADDQSK